VLNHLFSWWESPKRREFRQEFTQLTLRAYAASPPERAATGHAINLVHSAFRFRFGSAAAFSQLPHAEKASYEKQLKKLALLTMERKPHDALGVILFKGWVVALATEDAKLARQFEKDLEELSRAGAHFAGTPTRQPERALPAGYHSMSTEQKALSARFIAEHQERQRAQHLAAMDQAMHFVNTGDYGTSVRLLQPLANCGLARAQFALGILLREGSDKKRHEQSLAFARSAAAAGIHVQPRVYTPPDLVHAYMWLTLAMSDALSLDIPQQAHLLRELSALEGAMSTAELENAHRLLNDWRPIQ